MSHARCFVMRRIRHQEDVCLSTPAKCEEDYGAASTVEHGIECAQFTIVTSGL